jgi:hypothetical protein
MSASGSIAGARITEIGSTLPTFYGIAERSAGAGSSESRTLPGSQKLPFTFATRTGMNVQLKGWQREGALTAS